MPPGFEPGNNGFADRGLTAWLWHHLLDYYAKSVPYCQVKVNTNVKEKTIMRDKINTSSIYNKTYG